jgi:hypothetical protein
MNLKNTELKEKIKNFILISLLENPKTKAELLSEAKQKYSDKENIDFSLNQVLAEMSGIEIFFGARKGNAYSKWHISEDLREYIV